MNKNISYLLVVVFGLCIVLAQTAGAAGKTFRQHKEIWETGQNPVSITASDLNDDGIVEILTADRGVLTDPREERPANDELTMLVAPEPLAYEKKHPSLKTGFGPYAIAIANIDALKWPDIIVVAFHATRGRNVSLFLNILPENLFRPETFEIPTSGLSCLAQRDGDDAALFTVPGLTSLVVRDFNDDSLRDVVATGWCSDVLVYLPGDAERYFGDARFFSMPGAPCHLDAADFDGDGIDDLAVALHSTGKVALWRGGGDGNFEEVDRFLTRGRLPGRVRAADFNGDGVMDLAVMHMYTDDSVVLFYGDGDFRFSHSQEILLGPDREVLEVEPRDMVTGDFNLDGRVDIAVAGYASGEVLVLLSEKTEKGAETAFSIEHHRFSEGRPRALCVADFDNNGVNDLGVALWEKNGVALLLNTTPKPEK